jgi:hypothetical protein
MRYFSDRLHSGMSPVGPGLLRGLFAFAAAFGCKAATPPGEPARQLLTRNVISRLFIDALQNNQSQPHEGGIRLNGTLWKVGRWIIRL